MLLTSRIVARAEEMLTLHSTHLVHLKNGGTGNVMGYTPHVLNSQYLVDKISVKLFKKM